MNSSERHNTIVAEIIREIGPKIIAVDGVSAQCVVVESLLAGMVGLIARTDGASLFWAEGIIRAIAVAARERLPKVMG